MALTHRVGLVYSSDAGTITNTTDTYSDNGEVNWDGTIPGGTTNEEIDVAITVANVKSMVIFSTQALTLKTNSTTTPGATIVLAANKQLVWTVDHAEAIPLVVNVTKMYATNAGGTVATLKMRFLVHVSVP